MSPICRKPVSGPSLAWSPVYKFHTSNDYLWESCPADNAKNQQAHNLARSRRAHHYCNWVLRLRDPNESLFFSTARTLGQRARGEIRLSQGGADTTRLLVLTLCKRCLKNHVPSNGTVKSLEAKTIDLRSELLIAFDCDKTP